MTSPPTHTTEPTGDPPPAFFAVSIVADHGVEAKARRPLCGRAPREP